MSENPQFALKIFHSLFFNTSPALNFPVVGENILGGRPRD